MNSRPRVWSCAAYGSAWRAGRGTVHANHEPEQGRGRKADPSRSAASCLGPSKWRQRLAARKSDSRRGLISASLRFEKFDMPYESFRIEAGPEPESGTDGGIGAVRDAPLSEGRPMTLVTVPVADLAATLARVTSAGGEHRQVSGADSRHWLVRHLRGARRPEVRPPPGRRERGARVTPHPTLSATHQGDVPFHGDGVHRPLRSPMAPRAAHHERGMAAGMRRSSIDR